MMRKIWNHFDSSPSLQFNNTKQDLENRTGIEVRSLHILFYLESIPGTICGPARTYTSDPRAFPGVTKQLPAKRAKEKLFYQNSHYISLVFTACDILAVNSYPQSQRRQRGFPRTLIILFALLVLLCYFQFLVCLV